MMCTKQLKIFFLLGLLCCLGSMTTFAQGDEEDLANDSEYQDFLNGAFSDSGGGWVSIPENQKEMIFSIKKSIERIHLIWNVANNPYRNYAHLPKDQGIFDLATFDRNIGIISTGDYKGIENLNADGIAENITTSPYEIPLAAIASEARVVTNSNSELEKYIIKPKGIANNIVLNENISYIIAPKIKYIGGVVDYALFLSNSSILDFSASQQNRYRRNNTKISYSGYIYRFGIGIIGRYALRARSDSHYYRGVKITLNDLGVSGIENLEINMTKAYQDWLQAEILPPLQDQTSDAVDVRIIPTECITPGDSYELSVNVTLSNSVLEDTIHNGYGPSGDIFDETGEIIATYHLFNEEPNGDGTRTYTDIEIKAVNQICPPEALEFIIYPTIDANGNTYGFDLPQHN